MTYRRCVPLTVSHFLSVLSCPFLCHQQFVSAPCSLALSYFLGVLTCLSFYGTACKCPSLLHSLGVLTCPFCGQQSVSAPCILAFSWCPNLSLLWLTGSECPLLSHFLFMSNLPLPLWSTESECPLLSPFS
jgi:hypothetical protein